MGAKPLKPAGTEDGASCFQFPNLQERYGADPSWMTGERLSYKTLDVEHVGGVYETMLGFQLEKAMGLSVSLKAAKAHGAPSAVNLEALLSMKPADRTKCILAVKR